MKYCKIDLCLHCKPFKDAVICQHPECLLNQKDALENVCYECKGSIQRAVFGCKYPERQLNDWELFWEPPTGFYCHNLGRYLDEDDVRIVVRGINENKK